MIIKPSGENPDRHRNRDWPDPLLSFPFEDDPWQHPPTVFG